MNVTHRREAPLRQPGPELGAEVVEEVSRHVVDVGGLVDGDSLEAGGVEGRAPGGAAFGRAAEAIGLQLARYSPLAVEVHGIERGRWMEGVPSQAVQAPQLFLHGGVTEGER